MQALGFSGQALQRKHVERRLLEAFASKVVTETPSKLGPLAPQTLWDLSFVSKICSEAEGSVKALVSLIERISAEVGGLTFMTRCPLLMSRLDRQVKSSLTPEEAQTAPLRLISTIDLQLARNRLLLGPLLPPSRPASAPESTSKPALSRGRSGTVTAHVSPLVPGEQDLQLAVDVAKPASRFGMLLIASTDGRP